MNFADYKDIYVFIEQRNGNILDVGYELLGEARKLVEQIHHVKYQVKGILVGDHVESLAKDVIYHGADEVIICEHPMLRHYDTESYTKVLTGIIDTYKPDSLLIGATVIGRDLAPRVAARVNTGLTADATILEVDQENENSTLLWVTRPAFGGNLYGTIICPNHRPQMATIRPGVFEVPTLYENRIGKITRYEVEFKEEDLKVKLLEVIKKATSGVDLTKAQIIVSGGRGIGNNFKVLEDFAQAVGGVVGASRAAVDEGFAKKEMQVGQTGKTVRPRLYIACGISGAVQHVAGMDKSDFIIAINKDKGAAIFNYANVGIVGDALEILPLLQQELVKQ